MKKIKPIEQISEELGIILKDLELYGKFKVKLLENADNDEKTIFRSKAVGEPPLLLAISHFLAIKDAIKAANPLSKPELLNAPATPSEILKVIRA